MATTQANINISVQGQEQIQKLQTSLGHVQTAMSNLKTAAVVGSLIALGKAALQSADQISDLSNASGVAIGKLYEFKNAMQAAGGEAGDMPKAISQFTMAIDEARGGSVKAQNQFAQLGVSLNDLRKLSEQEIMQKAVAGFDLVGTKSELAGLKMAMFGKSFRTVDAKDFGDRLLAAAGSGDKYANSIERAAKLQDQLDVALGNVKMAFLEAFSPAIKLLTDINDNTGTATGKMDGLITAFKVLGAVIITTTAVGALKGLVAALGLVGRGVGIVTSLIPAFGAVGGAISAVFAVASKFNVVLRALAVVIGVGMGIFAATQLFSNFGDIAENAMTRVAESVLSFAATLARLPNSIWNFLTPKGMNISEENPLSGWLKNYEKGLADARALKEKAAGLNSAPKPAPSGGDVPVDTTAIDNVRKSIKDIGDEFTTNNIKRMEGLRLDAEAIGRSKDQNDLAKVLNDIEQARIDKVNQLAKARDSMSKENKANEANLIDDYNAEIAVVNALAAAEKDRAAAAITNISRLQAAEQLRLFGLQQQIDLEKALNTATDDMVKGSMTSLQKKYYDIEAASRDAALAAIHAEEGRRGGIKLSRAEQDKFFAEAAKGNQQQKDAAADAYNNSRTFATGWKQAFNDYVESATNAAAIARSAFETAAKALEDTLIDAFKTGKVNWKQFLATVLEDLARSQLKQTLGQIFGLFGGDKKSSGGGTGGILAGLVGGMAKASTDTGQAAKVQEIEKTASTSMTAMTDSIKEFGSATSNFLSNMFSGFGNLISNLTSGLGSIISSIGGTLFDVIGSIGGTLFDIIGSLGSGLGDILGSLGGGGGGGGILSTLFDVGMSLFGFANGGVIPNNKPVIVGERGPELLFGAGGMGVRSNEDSFGGGSTVVTYNINAVDALSFKQMIAADPTFLYAVTQQGAKGMPVRR